MYKILVLFVLSVSARNVDRGVLVSVSGLDQLEAFAARDFVSDVVKDIESRSIDRHHKLNDGYEFMGRRKNMERGFEKHIRPDMRPDQDGYRNPNRDESINEYPGIDQQNRELFPDREPPRHHHKPDVNMDTDFDPRPRGGHRNPYRDANEPFYREFEHPNRDYEQRGPPREPNRERPENANRDRENDRPTKKEERPNYSFGTDQDNRRLSNRPEVNPNTNISGHKDESKASEVAIDQQNRDENVDKTKPNCREQEVRINKNRDGHRYDNRDEIQTYNLGDNQQENPKKSHRPKTTNRNRDGPENTNREEPQTEQPNRHRNLGSQQNSHKTEIKTTTDNEVAKPDMNQDRDRWIWSSGGENESKQDGLMTPVPTVVEKVTVDDRASFDGSKCPKGHVKVNSICVPTE